MDPGWEVLVDLAVLVAPASLVDCCNFEVLRALEAVLSAGEREEAAAIAADFETSQPSEPDTPSFCARPDDSSCIRWPFPCFDTPGSSG